MGTIIYFDMKDSLEKILRAHQPTAMYTHARDYGFGIRKHVLVLKYFPLCLNKLFPFYFHIW